MKIKKLLAVVTAVILIAGLSGCGQKKEEKPVTYEIAMLSDTATIEDGSFNEAVWQGIEAFVEENPVSYKSYLTTEAATDAYLRTVEEAIDGGAKLVITAGASFDETIYEAQSEHPEISFVLLDGQPKGGEKGDTEVRKNTVAVTFAEEQAGYLAGYAAVKEGYKKLGFAGGKELPPVQRFGYGFVQGADAAAKDMGTSNVRIKYGYTGTFDADAAVEQQAADWYQDGTEVIFACAGGAGRSIMKAAEAAGGYVIGVDTDQSKESETVLIAAVKNIDSTINDILWGFYGDEEFAGGQTVKLDAENGGVGLSIASSRMKNFTKDDYNRVFSKLENKNVTVKGDGITDVKELETNRVKLDMAK
ncbi:BMP family ABC transporter substrate-binding protein [Anaerovorax odorimutans]|uniref:BMP family ABC transporter substrate-binding protein n=1 Tax=Anaerovorax odorimutans TaxID=109327 RepID=A0ABT1RPJ4_9FIRM|nr:BMP family ABC transporter substrate-binding protein [Anaerovorax odorimutans]MCQ4637088.1 BMP family ABC transporter substrate-binding protein [Anaerovorax odorimutans]